MESFKLDRNLAHLAILQRIELTTPFQKRTRKLFGRYLFSKIFSKYMLDLDKISKDYYKIMYHEYLTIKKFMNSNQNILSIGAGIGGLEAIINNSFEDEKFTFIERDFVSKKIRYGWDNENSEAYNKLYLLRNFLLLNQVSSDKFTIVNFDKKDLPKDYFNIIISLYSLDFHYNFEIYKNYLCSVSDNKTIIIFDTIRPDFFKEIFEYVDIIKEDNETLHKSKRIACRKFKK